MLARCCCVVIKSVIKLPGLLGVRGLQGFKFLTTIVLVMVLSGCLGSMGDISNACDLLSNKRSWYKDVTKSSKRWNVPKHTILAIIHQESKFDANAKPPRKKLFGLIPTFRPSSAYGYPQALDSTWRNYKKATNNRFADRDDFTDAVDFVGWYLDGSRRKLNIPVDNVKDHYLAYHEGRGGYAAGSYKNKKWLLVVANKVNAQSAAYAAQLQTCDQKLSQSRLLFF